MSIETALKIVRKDFKRRLMDPLTLIILLSFPLVLTLIIGLAFSPVSRGIVPETEMLIADLDRDVLSGLVKGAFQQAGEDAPPVSVRDVTVEEGRRAIERGQGSALLIIPEGFSRGYLDGETVRLTLVKNPAQIILPEIAEQYTDILALFGSFVSRFFEEERDTIRRLVDGDTLGSKFQWAGIGAESFDKMDAVEKYLLPVKVSIVEAGEQQAPDASVGETPPQDPGKSKSAPRLFNIFEYILPGLAVFGAFFVAQLVFREIFTERQHRTLARLLTAPVSMRTFLLGKALSGFALSLVGLVLMQLVGYVGFGVAWGPPALVLLMDLIAILSISGVCLLIFSLVRTQAQGEAVLTVVILFMALFGGSIVPLSQLPPFFSWVAAFTLNGNLLEGFNSLIFRDTLVPVWPKLLVVSVSGMAASLVGCLLLGRRFAAGGS